jgi:hypothetical protein
MDGPRERFQTTHRRIEKPVMYALVAERELFKCKDSDNTYGRSDGTIRLFHPACGSTLILMLTIPPPENQARLQEYANRNR